MRFHRDIRHHHWPNTGKVEPSQEGTGSQVARAANVDQELDGQGPQLTKLAGKLVHRRQSCRIVLAGKIFGAPVAEGLIEQIEFLRQPHGLRLSVNPGFGDVPHRQRRAQDLRGLFGGQAADVFLKVLDPVHLREQHIDGQPRAQPMREIRQPGIKLPRSDRARLGPAGFQKAFAIHTQQHGSRSLRAAAEHRAEAGRNQPPDQASTICIVAEQRPSSLHQDVLARIPDVYAAGGNNIAIAKYLAGHQFGFQTGMNRDAGFRRSLIADDQETGEMRNLRFGMESRRLQTGVRLAERAVHFARSLPGRGCRRLLLCDAATRIPPRPRRQ